MSIKTKIFANNNKAHYEYEILDTIEAGIVLHSTEVKSIRNGMCNIADGYISIENNEAFLLNVHISQYKFAYKNTTHDPMRKRKLLLHRYQIDKFYGKTKEKGLTIIPLRIRNGRGNFIKLDIGVGKGKKLHDKRRDKKEKDLIREARKEKF